MNVEAWDAIASLPPVTLPAAFEEADYTPPPPLVRGLEPGPVVILVEIDVFTGAG